MNNDAFKVKRLVPESLYSDFARDSRGVLYFVPYDWFYLRLLNLDENRLYTAYTLPDETVESAVRRAHKWVHVGFALCFILTVIGMLYFGLITESTYGYLFLGYEPIRSLAPWLLKSHLDKLPLLGAWSDPISVNDGNSQHVVGRGSGVLFYLYVPHTRGSKVWHRHRCRVCCASSCQAHYLRGAIESIAAT